MWSPATVQPANDSEGCVGDFATSPHMYRGTLALKLHHSAMPLPIQVKRNIAPWIGRVDANVTANAG